jgi:hypothetical protein
MVWEAEESPIDIPAKPDHSVPAIELSEQTRCLMLVLIFSRTSPGTLHFLIVSVFICAPEAEEVLVPQLGDEEGKVLSGLHTISESSSKAGS